jgi:hypothetical protein
VTYQEAVALYPHDQVNIQIDDIVRPMTPAEYEEFIQRQVNYEPSPEA